MWRCEHERFARSVDQGCWRWQPVSINSGTSPPWKSIFQNAASACRRGPSQPTPESRPTRARMIDLVMDGVGFGTECGERKGKLPCWLNWSSQRGRALLPAAGRQHYNQKVKVYEDLFSSSQKTPPPAKASPRNTAGFKSPHPSLLEDLVSGPNV